MILNTSIVLPIGRFNVTIPYNNDNPYNQGGDNNSDNSYGSYNSDSGDKSRDGDYVSYPEYQAATGASSADEGAYGTKDIGNWPESLVPAEKQKTLGIVSLLLTIFLGFIGMFPSGYYLFYLDNSVEKNDAAKLLNKLAFFIPIVMLALSIIFIVFIFGVFAISST